MRLLRYYWQQSFSNGYYRVAAHVLFWCFLLFGTTRESVTIQVNLQQHIWVSFTGILLATFLFYPLVYGIFPLLQKRKFLSAAFCFVVYYIIAILLRTYHLSVLVNWHNLGHAWISGQDFRDNILHRQLTLYALFHHFFSSVAGMLNIISIPLLIKFTRYAYRSGAEVNRIEKEKTRLNLELLKSQLNPHLLFNTLNNLQSLIVHNEKERSVLLLDDLSSFLRFSLYETNHEFIPLHRTIPLFSFPKAATLKI
jgi:hypothetical protein